MIYFRRSAIDPWSSPVKNVAHGICLAHLGGTYQHQTENQYPPNHWHTNISQALAPLGKMIAITDWGTLPG